MTEATSGEPVELVDAIRAARAERVSDSAVARLEQALAAAVGQRGDAHTFNTSNPGAPRGGQAPALPSSSALLLRGALAGAALALVYGLLPAPQPASRTAPAESRLLCSPLMAADSEGCSVQPHLATTSAPMSTLADAPCWPALADLQPSHTLSAPCSASVAVCPPLMASRLPCSPLSDVVTAAPFRARAKRLPPRAASAKIAAPEAELELLQEAQAALRTDPGLALARSERHLLLYPRGLFSEEREMLAIEALQKLKHKAEAWQRARAFVERFPLSPHARRVRALLDASVAPVP